MALCACPLDGKPDAPDQPPPEPFGSGLFQQRYFGDEFPALSCIACRQQQSGSLQTGQPVTDSVAAIQINKKLLRQEMRRRRQALGPAAQGLAERALYRRLVTSALFRFSRRIAFTIARDGEIGTRMLAEAAWRRGKRCYLPVMSRFGETRLTFRLWHKHSRLRRSYYDIPEPALGKICPAPCLSLVLFPLVAFDTNANRLGMGKGYYDHTFAFKRRSGCRKPALVGLAHDCQKTATLPTAPWDVPLEGIVTDQYWYHPPRKEQPA